MPEDSVVSHSFVAHFLVGKTGASTLPVPPTRAVSLFSVLEGVDPSIRSNPCLVAILQEIRL